MQLGTGTGRLTDRHGGVHRVAFTIGAAEYLICPLKQKRKVLWHVGHVKAAVTPNACSGDFSLGLPWRKSDTVILRNKQIKPCLCGYSRHDLECVATIGTTCCVATRQFVRRLKALQTCVTKLDLYGVQPHRRTVSRSFVFFSWCGKLGELLALWDLRMELFHNNGAKCAI